MYRGQHGGLSITRKVRGPLSLLTRHCYLCRCKNLTSTNKCLIRIARPPKTVPMCLRDSSDTLPSAQHKELRMRDHPSSYRPTSRSQRNPVQTSSDGAWYNMSGRHTETHYTLYVEGVEYELRLGGNHIPRLSQTDDTIQRQTTWGMPDKLQEWQ
jgi:hypothetical protein